MEYWEYNLYIKTYSRYILAEKEKSLVKQAYYTAMFNNGKKVKKLSHYLNEIDRASNYNTDRESKEERKRRIEEAREIMKKLKSK